MLRRSNSLDNMLKKLQISDRISAGRENIALDVHPKGQDKIDDKGRTHREKGNIDEPGADTGSGDAHFLPNSRAYTEHLPLYIGLQSVHCTKL